MNETYNVRGAEATLQQGNKTALYANILDTCGAMRKKLDDLRSGKIKQAVSVFNDPNIKGKQLRVIMRVEDGILRTTYWMDDRNIWAYCEKKRKEFDEYRRHAATEGTQHMFREYFLSSWLLETYILMKYNIDLRSSEWADPSNSDFKKVNWIIDNDEFAQRYKLTTYSESRGIANPFNDIKVDMSGVDLGFLKSEPTKPTVTEGGIIIGV